MHRFYMSNEVNALEDFKKTPAEYALPILVEQYSLHRERRPPETNRNEIALKASQVATQIPGAGTVLRDMCTNFNTGVLTFRFRQYRGDLINCFIYSRTKEAVCFFGTMLNSGTNALGPGTMAQALCYMNIPGAPYGPDQWIDGSQFSAIEKWKVWWEANKSKFTQ